MDNFRALPKLNEKLEEMVGGTEGRLATVVAVYEKEVDVRHSDGSIARYPTSEVSVNIGSSGVLIRTSGKSRVFIPIHMSHPFGKHHWDKGTGALQIGDTNPENIAPGAVAFIAIGHSAKVGGWQATAIGYRAEATAQRSVAIGFDAVASVTTAIAIGYLAKANGGANGVAIGNDSAAGNESIAIGSLSVSDGVAVAVGFQTVATGNSSTAIGRQSSATNTSSTAIGHSTNASGLHSFAAGFQAAATGSYSVAVGRASTSGYIAATSVGYNSKSGPNSVAIGYNSEALYTGSSTMGSVAIGYGAKANTGSSVAIGNGAVAQYHHETRIKARGVIIESSQDGVLTTKLGLHSPNGTRYYITVSNTGTLSTTTTW